MNSQETSKPVRGHARRPASLAAAVAQAGRTTERVVPIDRARGGEPLMPGPTELEFPRQPDELPAGRWGRDAIRLACLLLIGPLAGAAIAGILVRDSGTSYESSMLVFLAFALTGYALRRPSRHGTLLPLVGHLLRWTPIALGAATLALVQQIDGLPGLSVDQLALCALFAALPGILLPPLFPAARAVRTVVVGAGVSGEMLARELRLAGATRYRLLGMISAGGPHESEQPGLPVLGRLEDLSRVVVEQEVDLLLLAGEAPRLAVFDELARSCLHLPVRLWELSGFYEETFGHVPVAEINSSWFQYIMHPHYRTTGQWVQRLRDVLLAAVLGVIALPIVALLAALVRRDGGPALFRQARIGEGGRPFTVLKLRTMHVGAGDDVEWALFDDPRTTRLGRLLRRTHLDELPQLWNVLRGDMSLVGPRPEQPGFVEKLERTIPFYSRRHLIKPGLTGWAQVRCGYAGSDFGSAWKLCHDLYYLKHRSMRLDFAILVDTVRTLVADPQYDIEPVGVSFILRPAMAVEGDTASIAAL